MSFEESPRKGLLSWFPDKLSMKNSKSNPNTATVYSNIPKKSFSDDVLHRVSAANSSITFEEKWNTCIYNNIYIEIWKKSECEDIGRVIAINDEPLVFVEVLNFIKIKTNKVFFIYYKQDDKKAAFFSNKRK